MVHNIHLIFFIILIFSMWLALNLYLAVIIDIQPGHVCSTLTTADILSPRLQLYVYAQRMIII